MRLPFLHFFFLLPKSALISNHFKFWNDKKIYGSGLHNFISFMLINVWIKNVVSLKGHKIYEILIIYFASDIYIVDNFSETFYKNYTNCANRFIVTLTYLTCATPENIYTDSHSFILSIYKTDEYKLYIILTALLLWNINELIWESNPGQIEFLDCDNCKCHLSISNINRNSDNLH